MIKEYSPGSVLVYKQYWDNRMSVDAYMVIRRSDNRGFCGFIQIDDSFNNLVIGYYGIVKLNRGQYSTPFSNDLVYIGPWNVAR